MRGLGMWALALLVASLCGCNLLLGIEPLKSSKPNEDGGMDAATSKADAAVKGKDGGVDGGKQSTGNGDGGKDAATEAGMTPHDAAVDGGSLTQDDAGGPATITVHGKVMDYFRHALSAVDVTIGSQSAVTDNDGKFTLRGVSVPYDVALVVSTEVNGGPARFAWVFQGLTRGDPTLQVYRGVPDRSGEVNITVNNVTFSSSSSQTVATSFAGPDGAFDTTVDATATDYLSGEWLGPATTQMSAHALLWNYAGSQSLPTMFLAHDAHPVGLSESAAGNVTFDLSASPGLTNGMVSGTVTNPTSNDRSNQVYVRWDDDAVIQIADDTSATGAFSYVVPALSNAGAIVAAIKGYSSSPPFAVAYKDGLVPGQTGIALTIPATPVLVSPADAASGVDGNTTFEWTGSAKVFVFTIDAKKTWDTVYVVTTEKQAQIPSPPISAFAANAELTWWVSTHESFVTVDDATGPEGMLDTFGYYFGNSAYQAQGPRRGAGSYAESENRGVTTKP